MSKRTCTTYTITMPDRYTGNLSFFMEREAKPTDPNVIPIRKGLELWTEDVFMSKFFGSAEEATRYLQRRGTTHQQRNCKVARIVLEVAYMSECYTQLSEKRS